ncbi:MAG: hypothetical protein R3E77_06485 [Steroidobacteraceae bacterium]
MEKFNRIEKYTTHWHDQFNKEPYFQTRYQWSDYDPAYRYAWDQRQSNPNSQFSDMENSLESGWEKVKGKSKLAWQDAKQAVRSGWHSIEHVLPGDADRDGR